MVARPNAPVNDRLAGAGSLVQSDVKESKTIQRCVKQGNNNGIVLDSCNTPGAVTIMDGMRVELEDAIAASDRPQSRRAHYFAPHMAMSLRVRGPGVHFDVELCGFATVR